MRTALLVSAIVAGFVPSTIAFDPFGATIFAQLNRDLTQSNHYGSPIPPWNHGSQPGWYYGPNPGKRPGVPCLNSDVCKWLDLFPHALHCPHKYPPHPPPPPPPPHHTTTSTHKTTKTSSTPTPTPTLPPPPPPDGYNQTFHNITAAVQADDFMTFGLVETVEDCKEMCNSVEGCTFVNSYHDVNGKDGSPLLTCSLFRLCHGPEDADNRGGQTQPDGSIDFIIESDGWCKVA